MRVQTRNMALADVASVDVPRFIEDVLDEMQVTDREYHHLSLSVPLTTEIVKRTRRVARTGDRVLLIGGTVLLAEVLVRLGFDLEMWRLPQTSHTPGTDAYAWRDVPLERLSEAEVADDAFSAIIIPFVVESLPDGAQGLLKRLRSALTPNGRIILATRNQTRLDTRLAAISGKAILSRRPAGSLSFSWPSLPVYAECHNDDIPRFARDAGLQVLQTDFVDASRLFLDLEPMQFETYLMKKIGQGVRRAAPQLRDTIIAELGIRPGDDGPLPVTPDVCIAVAAISGGDRLRQVLVSLKEQTYPSDRYEVLVVHDGRRDDIRSITEALNSANSVQIREVTQADEEGPSLRNTVLRCTNAAIVGNTDDSSILPGDWIEAAVMRFGDDTAAVSGPVLAGPDSQPKFLEVPGTRPDPAEREPWRPDLFPIANVFYRTSAANAVGGFGQRPAETEVQVGWDTDLAWRLHRAGWKTQFIETLAISTVFRPSTSTLNGQVRRAEQLPALYGRVPELRPRLVGGIFASRQSMYFDLMLVGAFVARVRRNPRWLLASLPWLGIASRRFGVWPPRKWAPSAKVVGRIGLFNLLWLIGFIKGSIRARRVVL